VQGAAVLDAIGQIGDDQMRPPIRWPTT
jgi:hypothetical protein